MKVIQVCFDQVSDHIGGMYTAIRSFEEALRDAHVSTSVIAFVAGERNNAFGIKGINDTLMIPPAKNFLGRHYSWNTRSVLSVAEEVLKKADIIIIHVLYRYHAQWAANCANRHNIPTIIVPHGCLARKGMSYSGRKKKFWLRFFGPSTIGRSKAILFASNRERQEAVLYFFGAPAVVIPWCTQLIPNSNSNKRALFENIKSRYGILENEKVMLYVGRLHPIKRIRQTLSAFARTSPENWHMLVVGPDSDVCGREMLENFLSGNAKPRIHFIGPIVGDEKYDYYRASDVYVLLSEFENFSFTAADALGSGLPVLLSEEVALSEDVKGVGCGWVINARHDKSIDDGMCTVFTTDPEDIRRRGASGFEWACQNLSFDVFRERILSLVRSCINEKLP